MIEGWGSQHCGTTSRSAEALYEREITGSIEGPMNAASVVGEFRIRKSVELGTGEMPAVEAYEDCELVL